MRDLQLVNYNSTSESFEINQIGQAQGRTLLLQKIVKLIYQETGTNWWDRNTGSDIMPVFKSVDPRDEQKIRAQLPILLNSITQQIHNSEKEEQPLSERLEKLEVRQATLDLTAGIWDIIIDVYTQTQEIIPIRLS